MPTAQPLRTGDPRRLGAYELSGRLGEGGQGAVFLGSRDGETYAVKLLHGPVGDEGAAFLREVELAKHVARFCTAQVIDAGFDEGRPYIVSEYVDGPSLQREVALTGPRRGGALERLAVSTATALTAIHRAGIVHRDFKPQNVLLGSDGPRVIDFGLARALDAAATVSGRGVGTPAYMAPEQITALAVTGAADVFSWGATMCFAANATAPFGQDSVAPVLHRILTAPPELGRLDGRLRTLVEACLDKDARNRPTSRDLLFELLGESPDVPSEVLSSPPAHILRAPSTLVPEPRPPLAEAEATGVSGGYRMPGSAPEAGNEPSERSTGPQSIGDGPVAQERFFGGGPDWSGSGGVGGGVAVPERSGHRWSRAALAVSVALLVTAAVLFAVVVPAMDRRSTETAGPSAQPTQPAPVTSESPSESSTPTRTREPERARPPSTTPPVNRPVTVPVPALVGMDREEASSAVKRAGLVLGTVSEVDSPQRIGQVLSSDPAPGTVVNKGSRVSLGVSAGLAVPSVTGMQRKAAEAALTGAGLTVGAVTRSCSDSPAGQVLASRPEAGSRVAGGTSVSLTVARPGATVPSVVGRSQEDGQAALAAAGFTARLSAQVVEDESRVGKVLSQNPRPGTCAGPGATVTIVVGQAGRQEPDPGEPSPTLTPTGRLPG
ncbi:PASTA domain-containing protein [Nonomuraea jiangxiensis]|uniref:non-specific serine/threonine protein kinase n=1 Tax=Nonomuraea jiangxiensis TaxID=633440 RepID=A0A1G9TCT8_9ACTN|nr:PASTA domain-containing protein [Nonomuraea jiangxiensis]SDM45503.1 Serine/threonine protein kinase [Nonomuraea jiangxiensis]